MAEKLTVEERVEAIERGDKQRAIKVGHEAGRLPNWTTQVIVIGLGVLMLFNINARAGTLERRVISLESQIQQLSDVEEKIAEVSKEASMVEKRTHELEMVLDDILEAIDATFPHRNRR